MASEAAKEDDESLIEQIEEEIDKEIKDPVKESTVDYYLKAKDKVMLNIQLFLTSMLHNDNRIQIIQIQIIQIFIYRAHLKQ